MENGHTNIHSSLVFRLDLIMMLIDETYEIAIMYIRFRRQFPDFLMSEIGLTDQLMMGLAKRTKEEEKDAIWVCDHDNFHSEKRLNLDRVSAQPKARKDPTSRSGTEQKRPVIRIRKSMLQCAFKVLEILRALCQTYDPDFYSQSNAACERWALRELPLRVCLKFNCRKDADST